MTDFSVYVPGNMFDACSVFLREKALFFEQGMKEGAGRFDAVS